ncbi:unnamed protein product [Rotaria sp. Silwood2]|nr:unnamed protein product [Rotaria sp. Silwood2]CAF4418827.1 unnamed protein product [Rotaria sp. Silwood2]
MDQLFGALLGTGLGLLTTATIDAADHHRQKKKRSSTFTSGEGVQRSTLKPTSHTLNTISFSQTSSTDHSRAVLVAASLERFGKTCERLVNIAFHSSQTFPTMMGTCADISDYLRKELAKQYPTEYFHIIIGENHAFGFAVDDAVYLAEIEQDRYRVLIFTAKQNVRSKADTHDANSTMSLDWNLISWKMSNK